MSFSFARRVLRSLSGMAAVALLVALPCLAFAASGNRLKKRDANGKEETKSVKRFVALSRPEMFDCLRGDAYYLEKWSDKEWTHLRNVLIAVDQHQQLVHISRGSYIDIGKHYHPEYDRPFFAADYGIELTETFNIFEDGQVAERPFWVAQLPVVLAKDGLTNDLELSLIPAEFVRVGGL